MCGIMGVCNNPEASQLVYMGLYAQQHRGQEGSGIVSAKADKLYRRMGQGLVSDVFSNDEIFEDLPGDAAIGHNRYSTTGENNQANVGPLIFNVGSTPLSIAHNGNLVNLGDVRKQLESEGAIFQTTTDTEIIVHLLAREKGSIRERLAAALQKVEGAFSLLIITPEEMIAARDPWGIRPISVGKLEDSIVVASETCAFDLLDATVLRDLEPGEMTLIRDGNIEFFRFTEAQKPAHCIFEFIYFSRPDSRIFGENVDKVRRKLGKNLALQNPEFDADIVISVPDSSNTCALGYAQRSKIKYEIGLIRNHYVGRTFIFPNQWLRDLKVRLKFNPVAGVLEEKSVVVVDDSIVRGTTLRKLTRLLRKAGAAEVHARVSSPPVKFPCYYGMDFPTKNELAANKLDIDGIRDKMAVDSLEYLELENLMDAVDGHPDHFCTACFSGKYPIENRESEGCAGYSA